MSDGSLDSFLRTARRRRWAQVIVRRMSLGLTIGCVAGLLVCLLCVRLAMPEGPLYAVLSIGAGLVGGAFAGLAGRSSLRGVALQIDQRARLKDRIHSALQFERLAAMDDYHRLQIRDALRAISGQAIPKLFPWRWPREGTWAVVSGIVAVFAMTVLPSPQPVQASAMEQPLAVRSEATILESQLEQWEETAEDLDSEELRELTKDLREMLKDLGEQADTVEEAMVQLAKMTSAVDHAASQFNPLVLQQALQDLAEGLKGLDGFERTSQMLKQEEYDRAAEAAESFGQAIGSRQKPLPASGGMVDGRLGQLAAQAQAAGLGELSEALSAMQKAVRSGSPSECEGALRRLGAALNKYGKRLKIGRAMRSQLNDINERKQCLSCGYCAGCKSCSKCQGGNCLGIKMGSLQFTSATSKKPSQSAGTAISMNKFGSPTELRGSRHMEHIAGQLGEGESETEVEVSPEGQQSAGLAYRQVYARYHKLSDAVIAEEAIPLAHRQTIKRYFELIHPDRVDPATQLKDVRLDVIEASDKADRKDGAQ